MKLYRLVTFIMLLSLIISFAGVPNAAAVDTSSLNLPAQITPQCAPVGSCPKLEVTKTADAASVMAGDAVGYKIKVVNTGIVALTGVVITDQLPAGMTWKADSSTCSIDANNALYCAVGGVAVGGSVTVHVTATSPAGACATLTNTANAWADGFASTPSNMAEIVVNCATLAPDIQVVKTAGSAMVAAGSPLSFTLSVSNVGTGTAQQVILSDSLPSLPGLSWSVGQVTGGGACALAGGVVVCDLGAVNAGDTRTVVVSSPTTADSCGLVSNTATVTATNEAAGKDSNNTATASTMVNCPPPLPAVKVVKTADNGTVNQNEVLGFNITVQNTGATTVKNFRVTDQLAAGMTWMEDSPSCSIDGTNMLACAFGDLAAGGMVSVHVTAPAGTSTCGDLSNTAYAVGDNLPQQPSNTAIINVNCAPDVSVTKVGSPAEINYLPNSSGGVDNPTPGTFTLTVNNHGTAPAQNVALTDSLPVLLYAGQPANTGLSWTITQQPAAGTCAITNAVLSCTFASLGVGQSETLMISTPTDQVPKPASGTANIVNTVSVTIPGEPVANRTDNQSTATIKINWSSPLCVSDPPFNGSYFDKFSPSDTNAATGWSKYQIDHTREGSNTPFLGRFTNGYTTLTLGCLPVNTYLTLSFDLYILGSMDGNAIYIDTGRRGPGPDMMRFLVADPRVTNPVTDGDLLLQTTFTNWPFFKQAYPGSFPGSNYPFRTGATAKDSLGFDYMGILMDSTYKVSLTFYNTRETQLFVFSGGGLQPLPDESWGINNVAIYPSTPTYLPVINFH